jgi:hypothetical protein
MKKLVFLFLAGFLILAFGATGYAQAKLEFRASGFIDLCTHYAVNVDQINPAVTPIYNALSPNYKSFTASGQPDKALDKKTAYWSSRAHLAFDAMMGKEITGRIQFEMDAARFGGNPGRTLSAVSDANNWAYWSTDRTAVEIKYIYIDFALPYFGIPVPMTVRTGAQPLAIRPNFLVGTDGAGVTSGINLDPVMLSTYYYKPVEGVDWVADDVDVYGLQASANLGQFKVGGYGLWYNMNSYPIWVATNYGYSLPPGAVAAWIQGTQTAKFGWLGFYTDGKAGPVNINFDIAYDWGKVKSTYSDVPNVKYSGWAGRLKVDYPWEKWNFGVVGMYASGSDVDKTSQTGLPGTTSPNTGALSTKVAGWMLPVGSEQGAINNESAVFYGMEAGATPQGIALDHNYTQMNKGGFGGTWFAKLYTSYKVTPMYKLTLQGLYIGDTTKNGNTFGTAVHKDGTLRDDKDIGFELDWINEFQLYKNLVFKVFGGYLWAGDAMDLYTGNSATGNFSMKNPWAIRTRLIYTF